MTYDRDLRRQHIIILILIGVNLGMAVSSFLRRDWLVGIACSSWVLNMFMWLSVIRCQQKGRDYARTVEAEIFREYEKESDRRWEDYRRWERER